MYEHFMTNLRAQLGEKAFTILWDQGRMMRLEQVPSDGEPAVISAPDMEDRQQRHEY
jgi:hypothetical protein